MSKVQTLRAFVKQRLSLAAEEIFELFERTIAEYEEQLCRQNKLLDAVFKPQLQLHRADVQLLLVSKDQDPPEQQDWSSSLDQDDPPELPHIKEEQEELWTNQEGEQLQGPEEAEIIKFKFTPGPVKSEEDDEEEPQSSQLHQRQTEEMKTETDGEDCGGPGPARDLSPGGNLQPDPDERTSDCFEPEAENSDDRRKSGDAQSKSNAGRNAGEKSLSCSVCGKQFSQNSNLKTHMRIHSGERPFSCSVCSKRFTQKVNLTRHMALHTGERGYSCRVCGKGFLWQSQLKNHQWVGCQSSQLQQSRAEETRETEADGDDCGGSEPAGSLKPEGATSFGYKEEPQGHNEIEIELESFSDSVCGQTYPQEKSLLDQMSLQSERKGFSCCFCKKTFQWRGDVVRHMRIHTGEKPYSCSVCGKEFSQNYSLTKHLRVHTGDKPFTCSVCQTSFSERSNFAKHMRVHTGEKQFSCSVCGKMFAEKGTLRRHLTVHTGEKPFACGVCGKRFSRLARIKEHKCVGQNSGDQFQQDLSREDGTQFRTEILTSKQSHASPLSEDEAT